MMQQMLLSYGGSTYGSGTSSDPYTSAYASKLAGFGNGNAYVIVNGTTRHVYVNNTDNGGAWILVTRAASNSTCHHGSGGSGGDNNPINPGGGCHDYSDSFINEISNDTSCHTHMQELILTVVGEHMYRIKTYGYMDSIEVVFHQIVQQMALGGI